MRISAPAKINWTLEVLGRRDDGYHEVRSILQTVDITDEITLQAADGLTLNVNGARSDAEDDLALRAAQVIAEAAGRPPHLTIDLTKRIPVAAGLGGGSSDATAVLRGANRLWGLNLGAERITALAATLGSDPPFFVNGGTALAEGRGEYVTPLLDITPSWLVLLVPPMEVPDKTRRMYHALERGDFSDGAVTGELARRIQQRRGLEEEHVRNAFERPAYEVFRGLAACRDALLHAGARRVHLAGAGPTLFAIARDEGEARQIAERLTARRGKVIVGKTLSAAEAVSIED
jgi:4-diphosphocytidyl-2-C-methyl-D-erythritol kinase